MRAAVARIASSFLHTFDAERAAVVRHYRSFLRSLDAESVGQFKVTYYTMILIGGLYLAAVADGAPDPIAYSMGPGFYRFWLGVNIICPAITLIGRHLMIRAAAAEEHAPNSAVGAAWMRLTGDVGVWGAIIIYAVCVFNTSWWGQPLYAFFYLLMGVPGGFMFTLRSWRRIQEIRRREQHLAATA